MTQTTGGSCGTGGNEGSAEEAPEGLPPRPLLASALWELGHPARTPEGWAAAREHGIPKGGFREVQAQERGPGVRGCRWLGDHGGGRVQYRGRWLVCAPPGWH